MLRPTIRSVGLSFGAQTGCSTFRDSDRPILIAGPNGSGKTTLVEGILRTLFGFDRRRGSDAARLEARRPWSGEAMTGEVTVQLAGEEVRIRRDFATDRVRVDSPAGGVEHFDGDGNPGASNQEARQYRGILTEVLGVPDLDAYRRTLFVAQGGLPSTSLGEHLLRVAAGGHARVDAARREIAESHRSITRRPIHPAARGAVNPRELEKLDDEIKALEARLGSAREAGERRGPLATERDHVAEKLAELDEQIRRLEEARGVLVRTDAVELESRHLREWSRKLDRAANQLRRRAEEVSAAAAGVEDARRPGVYPDDFQERLARVDVRWADLGSLDQRPPWWPLLLGILAVVVGAALFSAGYGTWAAVAAGVGVLAMAAWGVLRLDVGRRRRSLRARVARDLEGVPEAESLKPETRDRHLARFLGQRSATRRLEDARWELAQAVREARTLLRDARESGVRTESGSGRDGFGTEASPAVRRLGETLLATAASTRDRLAQGRYELERVVDASLGLPDGVPPTESGVADALMARRAERNRVQRDLQQIGQQLLERGTPAESTAALEAALEELVPRREALLRKAEVLEAAHALVTDAYDAFRDHDQDRLVTFVSEHAERLTDGLAGPIVVEEVLEDARVQLNGRIVPLGSPPLSFGEYHALLLAVRLGAADFLAGIGVLPPLIIDEPFAHLDREHAAAVWDLLNAVAAERQVIVTTQDELLIAELELEPDILLGA